MTALTVNGTPVRYDLPGDTPLVWALRDASNLTGTKYGCGTGECGACIVDIDGRATPSCTVAIATLEGAFVTTIEGLSRDRGHPVQAAFIAEDVTQCGFCAPGFIMAIAAFLRTNPQPTDAMIDAAITNACPCGSFNRVRRAIHRAAAIARGAETIAPAPASGLSVDEAARTVPALDPR